tara:strand:+ start:154 stop:708 length:555 start_codon:yes stop_codon:yes gene_type:complete
MSTKVKAAVLNRAFAQYRKDTNKVQAFTNTVSRQLVESGSSKDMGRMGEYLVKAELEDLGFQVKILNGIESCDLKVKVGESWKRVEVKTSRVGHQTYSSKTKRFNYNAIKTHYFDMIVFVFVDYDRTIIKVGGAEGKDFIDLWGSQGNNGVNISFGPTMRHHKEYGREIFLDINQKSVKLALRG